MTEKLVRDTSSLPQGGYRYQQSQCQLVYRVPIFLPLILTYYLIVGHPDYSAISAISAIQLL